MYQSATYALRTHRFLGGALGSSTDLNWTFFLQGSVKVAWQNPCVNLTHATSLNGAETCGGSLSAFLACVLPSRVRMAEHVSKGLIPGETTSSSVNAPWVSKALFVMCVAGPWLLLK